MVLPAGQITSITLMFSGTNSVIKLPQPITAPQTQTYLIDAFFSSYSQGDDKVHDTRKPAAELVSKTNIQLPQDSYQYINIDKNMTAGFDPYFVAGNPFTKTPKHQYLQFIPVAEISVLEKG